ncbi:retrovirus-related pol polyprotein from transposon TNT 1-94 [Tanacetum coccineum]
MHVLTEVIAFSKTLKEHSRAFKGSNKRNKEMKEIFEELEARTRTQSVFVVNFVTQSRSCLQKASCYFRDTNGVELIKEFVNKDLTDYYERVGIFHQKTVPRTPRQNDVVERQNRTLVEAARTMLIFSKAPMILWAEAVATACLQPKTDYPLFTHIVHCKTPYDLRKISQVLVSKSPFPVLLLSPHNKDLEILFQPMFDEYLEPPRVKRPVPPVPAAQVPVNSTGTPSSTTIDQDAHSPSHLSQSFSHSNLPSLHQGIAKKPNLPPLMKDISFCSY